jgi:hypothetical protein
MIYYCANGGGTLLAVFPGQLTPTECQAILDVISLNDEGNLIRFGVPEGVIVAHKHGWAGNTHGDAGIVYSPHGDYVIVEYLAQPESDWLVHEISFPILREVSRTVYNYFNHEEPYLEGDRALPEIGAEATPEGTEPESEGEGGQEEPVDPEDQQPPTPLPGGTEA